MGRPLIIAHRGASAHAPENTISAFRKAIQLGCDMIELDLRQSRDGHLVVIHDDTLFRTSGVKGRVTARTLSELKSLDVGSWFSPDFAGERIPTLEEVIACVKGKTLLNIEVKGGGSSSRRIEETLLAILRTSDFLADVMVSSFNVSLLSRLRRRTPKLRIGVLYNRKNLTRGIRIGRDLGAIALNLPGRRISGDLIKKVKNGGLAIYVYTLNSREEMVRAVQWGVDGIFTDDPALLRNVVRMHAENNS